MALRKFAGKNVSRQKMTDLDAWQKIGKNLEENEFENDQRKKWKGKKVFSKSEQKTGEINEEDLMNYEEIED